MTDTSSAVVEEMLAPNLPSPAPAPAPVPDADTTLPANGHPLDPDGDVAMQQPSPVLNGLVDVDDPPPPPASTSPYPQEPDDELGRPPAKRPRKYSDADRASLANVCASSLPSFFTDPSKDRFTPSCHGIVGANQRRACRCKSNSRVCTVCAPRRLDVERCAASLLSLDNTFVQEDERSPCVLTSR